MKDIREEKLLPQYRSSTDRMKDKQSINKGKTTLAKLQVSNYNINHVLDPELQKLFYKRAKAKFNVDLELEYIALLLNSGPENADSLVFRIKNSIKEMESHIEDFMLAHREYVERIRENATEEISFTIE